MVRVTQIRVGVDWVVWIVFVGVICCNSVNGFGNGYKIGKSNQLRKEYQEFARFSNSSQIQDPEYALSPKERNLRQSKCMDILYHN